VDDKVENQWHRIKHQELNRLFINQIPFCLGTFRIVSVCVCNKKRDTEKEEIKSEQQKKKKRKKEKDKQSV